MKARRFFISYILLLFGSLSIIIILKISLFPSQSEPEAHFNKSLLESSLFQHSDVKITSGTITAYCPGPCCNTALEYRNNEIRRVDWTDQVAVGSLSMTALLSENIRFVAVDPNYIPHGSLIEYNGTLFIALDSGANIKGTRLDICLDSHNKTVKFGRKRNQKYSVYTPDNPGKVISFIKRKFAHVAFAD